MDTIIHPTVPPFPPEIPQSKSKPTKIILLVGGIIVVFAATIFGYIALPGIRQGLQEADLAEKQLTLLLEFVSDKKFAEAYGLMSETVREAQSQEEFSNALLALEAPYSGFKSISQTGFQVEAKSGQPTTYNYSGIITYTDGDEGDIEATLVKENGEWKIHYVYVEISNERLEKFQGNQ